MYTKKEVLFCLETDLEAHMGSQDIWASVGRLGASEAQTRTNTFTGMISDIVDLVAGRLDQCGAATGRTVAQ